MTTKPTTTIRIDPVVKRKAGKVFDEIGITMSTAINTFLKAVAREGALPFDINTHHPKPKAAPRNAKLNRAFIVKKDEFYTQYEDIEKEMVKHRKAFKGKRVLCNCDDPFESAFFRFFVVNFNKFQLNGLVSTCYADSSLAGREYPLEGETGAYKAIVESVPEESLVRPDGSLDLEHLFSLPDNCLEHLVGDGDFRSDECKALLKEADIVVTNPPFSLFRDYIDLLINYDKDFIILGNMNATTTKEIFPLFRDNKLWYGESIRSGDRKFFVPDSYPMNASGCGVDENGKKFIRVKGVRWFTNLKTDKSNTPLQLSCNYTPRKYPTYDNYDAIEVGRTQNIPLDYHGVMGVPITFLDKYNPEQFEILMLANGNARTNVSSDVLTEVNYRMHPEDKGGVAIINGKRSYARILIRWKSK
ncbi:type II toxin-antitoxin system RelB/DinJ family antitoxin [Pseudidiomarina sp. CB1]|uniref:type II toxin-antitoxin system RelB/DinJ family antitoxin n=1 Tax=Pseudidiomarina sp. CB1 TaxID=2972484 RepID=UPI002161181C|nr:type II toxin-antitoxin system RelB/DinJ family antitoxin [Pseudidiomarina sp. CB1]